MELMSGIAIFVFVVLFGLHIILPKYKKIRFIICIFIATGLCLTKTMHGTMSAIFLIVCELIFNQFSQ